MSVRGANFYSAPDVATKTLTAGLSQIPNNTMYVRPADWPALAAIPDGTQKVSVLAAIFPSGSNYLSFIAGGNYTVDWGDGTSDSVSAGVQVNHTYDYANVNLSAVTTRGYKCATVAITPTGAANLTSCNFQVRPAVTGITVAGTYNVPILEIYMNVPNLTTFTLGGNILRFNLLEQITIQQNNITNWSNQFVSHLYALQQLVFLKTSPAPLVSGTDQIFVNDYSLKNIVTAGNAGTGATQFNTAFSTNYNLVVAPYLNTSTVTTMQNMFVTCPSLQQVPLYNTANVTNMGSMFQNCTSLRTVPLFDTNKVTSMGSMFNSCTSLPIVPSFNTSNVTSMNAMFSGCRNLKFDAVFDTANVTDMSTMFFENFQMKTAPSFNTIKTTLMVNMFQSCYNLQTAPAYNTANVTSMSGRFRDCASLAIAPASDTTKVTDVSNMFLNCSALKTVPSYNLANAVTGGTTMLQACSSLSDFSGNNINQNFTLPSAQLSSSAAGNILANLSIKSATANTITLALNPGIANSVPVTGVASTAGTAVLTISNTTGLIVGMTAISANINSGIATVANTGTNAITLTSHNLVNNTIVSFSTAVFTVGTAYTPLYVVNAATNTFQVANTIGGTALTVTANATPVVNYGRYISAIVANVSVTLAPGYASNTGNGTVNFRTFDTTIATLKNWTVSG